MDRCVRHNFHPDQHLGIQHLRSDERDCRLHAVKNMHLQRVQQQARFYRHGRVYPDGRIDDGVEFTSEVAQMSYEMFAHDLKLTIERRSEDRFTVFDSLYAGDRREYEVACAHTQR